MSGVAVLADTATEVWPSPSPVPSLTGPGLGTGPPKLLAHVCEGCEAGERRKAAWRAAVTGRA
jgi:hypothetical protein